RYWNGWLHWPERVPTQPVVISNQRHKLQNTEQPTSHHREPEFSGSQGMRLPLFAGEECRPYANTVDGALNANGISASSWKVT
ncbi:hypothetical protein, partial [Klebsiella pneumoniae]|uniref:hypothetical protein n=1 Tax=Klebsiella pneumoniae TaxID=573 RepID=UPI001967B8C7